METSDAGDGELVRQALAGRADAYARLARRWSPRVLAVCHARVGSQTAAAEDLAQETLLRGLRALNSLAEPERFGAWLCGIAHRTCLDWLKSSQRTEVGYAALGAAGEEAIAAREEVSRVDEEEENRRLWAEVDRLPEAYRQTLLMYYYQDCTYEELARTLGVSAATVNARLTKGRAILRERLTAKKREAVR